MTDQQKRRALLEECKKLETAWKTKDAALSNDDSLSDDEYEKLRTEAYTEYCSVERPLWLEAFYLQFPKRRGWFAETFVPSFGTCENRRLSAKQTEVCKRYCVGDDETWQNGTTYCRAGGYKVKLTIPRYSNGIGYITII